MTTTSEHIGVCIIVIDSNSEKILMGKRKNAYKSGYFGLPGGRIDISESIITAAKRELKEETGLMKPIFSYQGVVREYQDNYTFIHFIFVCSQFSGKLSLHEPDKCESWEWFKPSLLPTPILPGHLAGIEMYIENNTTYRDIR